MMVDLNSTNSIANGDYYYGHDHLYSPAVLFYEDGTGAEIVERYEYDAYGKVQVLTDSDGDGTWFDDAGDTVYASSQYGNPYTFTGRRLDVFDYNSTTGDYDYEIMYYRARYYDTDTGRFTQRDPYMFVDGMSVYEYTVSNSVCGLNPSGLVHLGVPATKWKCALVKSMLDLGASANPINNYLWEKYKSCSGGSHNVPFAWFDSCGSCRNELKDTIKLLYLDDMRQKAESFTCGPYPAVEYTFDRGPIACASSDAAMINAYLMKVKAKFTIDKICDGNCCQNIKIDITYTYTAKDRTDFNPGDTFNIPGGLGTIEDQLVIDCGLGCPFYIIAKNVEKETHNFLCSD